MDEKSIKILNTCNDDLIILFTFLAKRLSFKVVCGFRGEADQNKAFAEGRTKLKFPFGNHNKFPSNAVDVYPLPMPKDLNSSKYASDCYYFAGQVEATAEYLYAQGKIKSLIRYGGDWDRDNDVTDQTFNDLVHFETVKI